MVRSDGQTPTADWLQPPAEQEGLQRYVQTLRERAWVVAIAIAVALGFAIIYLLTAHKVYQAEADMLVTPVASDSGPLVSLGLLRESNDPTRDVETASRLITTINVAGEAKRILHSPARARDLLGDVSAQPIAQSNIVAVTAKGGTAKEAQNLANAFAEGSVRYRSRQMHLQINGVLPGLQAQARQTPTNASDPNSVDAAVATLEGLRGANDPTLRVETLADIPSGPISPKPALSLIGAIIAGLIVGVGAAFASQVLDPRLRREEQLRQQYRLPILARIPREKLSVHKPLTPDRLSAASVEAYRTLRGTLAASRGAERDEPRTIMVTGPSPSEGKTTSAVNLATSLAVAGNHVILIEADLRRPSIGDAFGVRTRVGVVSVLLQNAGLEDALVTTKTYGSNLGMLLADYEGGWIAELFSLPGAQKMLEEARELADCVVIDSPPLTEVIDTLPLARTVDDVVIVVRLGKSKLGAIARLAELLGENGVKPAGFVVVGSPRPARDDYYYRRTPGAETEEAPRRRLLGASWRA